MIRYRDLSITNTEQRRAFEQALKRVMDHGRLIEGPEVETFEHVISDALNTPHCVGLSSGTNALYLALKCLDIGPGDEVITSPISWIATLSAIIMAGAKPVFIDVQDDLNIDASLIGAAITSRTKAILPIHLTGRLCDMAGINEVANQHGLAVIEDAAQAFGAKRNGLYAGTFGTVGAFSLNPMKVFSSLGEAGCIVTAQATLASRVKEHRYVGLAEDMEVKNAASLNHRLDPLQAAFLVANLPFRDQAIERRRVIADTYSKAFSDCVEHSPAGGDDCVFYEYFIKVEDRNRLHEVLNQMGVESRIRYGEVMCDHPAFKHLDPGSIKNARALSESILCLPIHEKLTDQEIETVIRAVIAHT